MDDNEYEEIEAKALRIVSTLNKLKKEIEGYKKAKDETKEGLKSLSALLDSVSEAAKELSLVAAEIRGSDYIVVHDRLMERVGDLLSICDALNQKIEEAPGAIEKVLEINCAKREEAYAKYVTVLDERMAADASGRSALGAQVADIQEKIEARVEGLPATLEEILSKHEVLLEKHDKTLSDLLDQKIQASQSRDRSLIDRIVALEQMVARIDRNTQKGFGKERG